MDTNWPFQEPIDLEHKQYVLLNYLQKLDKNLNSFKLYPQFQEISLIRTIVLKNFLIFIIKEKKKN